MQSVQCTVLFGPAGIHELIHNAKPLGSYESLMEIFADSKGLGSVGLQTP